MIGITLLGILVFSLFVPPPRLGDLAIDKPAHVLAYAVLAFLVTSMPGPRWLRVVAWIAVVAVSFLLEGAQMLIPGRLAAIDDAAANVLGAVLGGPVVAAVFHAIKAMRSRHR